MGVAMITGSVYVCGRTDQRELSGRKSTPNYSSIVLAKNAIHSTNQVFCIHALRHHLRTVIRSQLIYWNVFCWYNTAACIGILAYH